MWGTPVGEGAHLVTTLFMVELYHWGKFVTTLTETASFSRKTLVRIGQVLAVIVALFILYRLVGVLSNFVSPPVSAPATVAFSKLPPLDLTGGVKIPESTQIRVETVTGSFPALDPVAKVFSFEKNRTTFSDLEQVSKNALRAGFSPKSVQLGQSSAKYFDQKAPGRILTIEVASGNFRLEGEYLTNPDLLNSRPKSLGEAQAAAVSLMRNLGLSEISFPENKITTNLFKVDNGRLIDAISLSGTNVVQVVFGMQDLDKIGVYLLNIQDPQAWVLVSQKDILEAEKAVVNVEKQKFATYPLKTSSAAYDELTKGGGVFNKLPKNDLFVVRDVQIGYVLSRKIQKYLQPVYVFKGDSGVMAFVPAVSNSWVETSAPQ